MRILIVEDEAVNRRLLVRTLEKWGHIVISTTDGDEAWTLLQKEEIQLVLSDWIMPRMTGLELCRRIRAAQFLAYVYFILVTSKIGKDDLVEGLAAGADDFISKPFHEGELRARINAGARIVNLEHELQARNRELSQAYDSISKDLHAASHMQQAMLPSSSVAIAGLQFAWLFCPHTFVAGDIFNFHQLDDDHVSFYMIDVAGHGVAAAMQSVTLSRFLSPLPQQDSLLKRYEPDSSRYVINPPEAVIRFLNNRFQEEADALRYFTMVYGVVNLTTNRVRLTQAGHPSPLHQRQATITVIGDGGFPVGMLPEATYESVEFDFQPGDRLLVYSDGVSECGNPNHGEFSSERLATLLREGKGLPLQQMVDTIEQQLRSWRGNNSFDDDVTLFAIERK
ncbi:MAG: SpoIIE family protein phosphatase [Deltaproteobacteria bacterium]|nr:SpoIIE family protein phosphatase [Deltaproteobacteria bacterium]